MSYLTVRGLEKRFQGKKTKPIINGCDLNLEPGDIYCLLGANGSGKTTLLRTILGVLQPDKGEALFFGGPLTNQAKRRIGYLEDKAPQFSQMRVRDYMRLSLELYSYTGPGIGQHAEYYLEQVGLLPYNDRPLSALSRGMERRLGLAEIISHEPDLLILDEPLEGLDIEGLCFFENCLSQCRKKKRAVIFTTHLYQLVQHVATRVGILHQGKIIEKDAQDPETVNWSLATFVLDKRMYDEGGFIKC